MSMRLLAFDTSTECLSVAVHDGQTTRAANETGGARASARLLPLAHELLAQAGMALRDLHGIAFGHGPGAFTGLRTSCAVAQGLAFGIGVPVLPLDSLMLVAEDARAHGAPADAADLGVAMDARIDQIYAARYRFESGSWHTIEPPGLFDLDDLLSRWGVQAPRVVAGSAWAAFGERLALPGSRRIDAELDRAQALMRLALQRWSATNTVPASQALPLYLRDKVALTTAERDAMRSAAAAR